jgi:hypothetical protein
MNYRNLLQAVLFPIVLFIVNWAFALIGFDGGGEIANQIAMLVVAALLTWFFGDAAAARYPARFQ